MRRSPLDKIVLETKELDMGEPKEILALALDPPGNLHIIFTQQPEPKFQNIFT